MRKAFILAVCVLTSPAIAAPQSCLAEVGKVRAQAYADMCRFFSTATHPPCNVANSCAMMQAEIDRTCLDKASCSVPKVHGKWHCSDKDCAHFSFKPAKLVK